MNFTKTLPGGYSSTTAEIVTTSEVECGDPITVELKGIQGTHVLRPLKWESVLATPGNNGI